MTQFSPDDIRILTVYAPVMLKMLRAREDRIVSRMYGAFRNGTTDHLSSIAELACLKDMINEINAAITRPTEGASNERTD